ncbi:hypothetical protein ASD21_09645 [Caulobacter sp. Root1455]|uniref:baseplate multidomain protein megatron n=1 Tax=Caulobacter sp. Root1455 TaxID=1736465 RepID=UPI0006FCEE50|nr:glycoside hydrolase/phage tail family protein [Caulobacter sp. Root1455]KQY93843.1 hypothetical protein ASD21_09645 [Caulobacter sp. Root1455]
MAQVILSAVGSALAGPIGGAIGSTVGQAIDNAAINALTPARQVGPRIPALRLSGAAEGAPMAAVFGRARVAGQVIWAARFKERWVDGHAGGSPFGSKGSPRTTSAAYSLSFAVAVCEGPIDGIGRVWADGKPMDMAGVVMRVHTGAEDQAPDPLIAAVEGEAPAYRGTAYVVFEDLPLGAYGNRPPQLSFEVFHRPRAGGAPAGLEDHLKGVCLIPGAGEFVYATDLVLRRDGLTRTTAETLNNSEGRPDLMVSLDQLQAQLPKVEEVTLVVAWFGDDLRCGSCAIRPKVETAAKATLPFDWRVNGVERADAAVVSQSGGGPAYGGTPADRAVLQAIAELKRRGLRVTLYPFVLMDVPAGAGLPDPYGGAAQGAYPWRGRITCHPAAGRAGSPDKTAAATAQVSAFFGAATAAQFGAADGLPTYSGPAGDWGLRRMLLHYAKLAQLAGGVDGFILGSELRGLTTVRDGASSYPAVTGLKSLAAEVRSLLGPATRLGYAADWSEYFGHQPGDGSGDVHFHLDPLWSDANIDFVGIDFYPPMADWRDGDDHLDLGQGGPHDIAYLRGNLTGGEGFDWFYASDAARTTQTRTPITDGAHAEPWVFRPKDLRGWWSHQHFNRPGGVRAATPTAWVPQSKPLRLVEFGCGAVDKGANAPNLFVDQKSAESALPPFSDGTRDEVGQRRALEAVLAHVADPATNPVSPVYGGPMIEGAAAWCWDARPFPDFPARSGVWADGPNWTLGHWLNGRAGIAPLPELVAALADRAGVAIDPGEAGGSVVGYVVDRPMRLRDALAPLLEAFALDPVERQDGVVLAGRSGPPALTVGDDDLAWPEDRDGPVAAVRTLAAPVQTLRLRFIDAARDYQTGAVIVRRESGPGSGEGSADLDAPLVLAAAEARAVAERLLAAADPREATVHLSPLAALRLEPGDRLSLDGATWRVTRIDLDEHPHAQLAPVVDPVRVGGDLDWTPAPPREVPGPPVLHVLDLPGQTDERPLAAVAAAPWRAFDIHAGVGPEALRARATAAVPATVGVTLSDLPAGPLHRFDRATRLTVRLEGAAPVSRDRSAVLAGANALAVRGTGGEWEILQFLTAEPVGSDVWTLSGLLRGQSGSDPAMAALTPAGAAVVVLDQALVRADLALAERGLPLTWRAAPAGGPASGPSMSETFETWRGLSARPWSPAHPRVRAQAGDAVVTWIRRTRLAGDGWDAEVPLGEEREVYRVEILDGGTVVRAAETTAPAFIYTAAQRAADFPAGPTGALAVRVAQGSALFGWGASRQVFL